MFYEFYQTNSYGEVVYTDNLGLYVCIEAENMDQAIERAELLGLYFDGIERGIDCPHCSGDRWSRSVEVFNHYSEVLESIASLRGIGLSRYDTDHFYILHFANGTKKYFPKTL